MDGVDQLALVVRLERLDGVAVVRRSGRDGGLVVGERGAAVDVRLALAEQVQVGSVKQSDDGHAAYRATPACQVGRSMQYST